MRPNIKGEYLDYTFLPGAIFAWFASAITLLLVSSVVLTELGCGEKILGYVSSAISFVSAAVAGVVAGGKRRTGLLYTALLTASALVVLLLTLGFLINSSAVEPSSVMSVISFSITGCMVGAVFFSTYGYKKKKYRPRI